MVRTQHAHRHATVWQDARRRRPGTHRPRGRAPRCGARNTGHRILTLAYVVVTPHLGAATQESQLSVALEAAQLLIDFLQKGVFQHAVNMAAVDRAEMEELRQYIDMAWRLGLLHAQMCPGAI